VKVLSTTQRGGQLRKSTRRCTTGDYLPVDSGRPAVLAFVRLHETETALVVINLGGKQTKCCR